MDINESWKIIGTMYQNTQAFRIQLGKDYEQAVSRASEEQGTQRDETVIGSLKSSIAANQKRMQDLDDAYKVVNEYLNRPAMG